jgi:adenine phosphoribosyltransferase
MKTIFFFLLFNLIFSRPVDTEFNNTNAFNTFNCIFNNDYIVDNLKNLIDDIKNFEYSNIIPSLIEIFPNVYFEMRKCLPKKIHTKKNDELLLKSGEKREKDSRVVELEKQVTVLENYPNKGFTFRDITSVIQNLRSFELIVDLLSMTLMPVKFDAMLGLEPHGFIFAGPLAYEYRKKVILARKKGRLPRETVSMEYDDINKHKGLEILKTSIKKGDKIVIVDDFLATGETFHAACKLIEKLGGEVVKILTVIEVLGYNARNTLLKGYDIYSIIKYEGK